MIFRITNPNKEEIEEPVKKKRYQDHPRKRGNSITVRVSDEEKATFEELYANSTVPSKQAYLLASILHKPILTEYGTEQYQMLLKEVQEIARNVRSISNNVNQLTRYCHQEKELKYVSYLKRVSYQLMNVLTQINDHLVEPLSAYPQPANKEKGEKTHGDSESIES